MSQYKQNLSQKWIEGYVKVPPSIKELAITKLAVILCQNNELKNDIIYESESLRWYKYSVSNCKWDNLIETRSTSICERLLLPPAIKDRLMVRIMSIALQLFSWNRQQAMFNFSPLFADSLLAPSDWTIEMRLDEKKIAERLVQDQKIPVSQRYKMACLHCLELSIHSLWNQISPENREDFLHYEESKLVQLWSYQLAGKLEEFIHSKNQFWYSLFKFGLHEGSGETVLQCWDKIPISVRRTSLLDIAMTAVSLINSKGQSERRTYRMYLNLLSSPHPFIDILCFLLAQMSDVQMVAFFQKCSKNVPMEDPKNIILTYFLRWPFLDLLIPIIKKLWKILPETHYEYLLLILAFHYSKVDFTSVNRCGYVDYDYGSVVIELLKETPDHFKRYVFRNNYHGNTRPAEEGKILLEMINKKTPQIRNIKIFQHLLTHVTHEEKKSFLRSEKGKLFCCRLILQENLELLNSMLRECLSKEGIAVIKKQILTSEDGKCTCFAMLKHGREEALNSLLNWGFPSKQEIFQFILKLFFRNKWFLSKEISDVGIEINCLDNIIQKYAPTEDARRKFKTQFIKKHTRDVCVHFICNSKWQEIDPFLLWCFSSEGDRKRFKKWFVREYAMFLCEYHLIRLNLQDAEQLLTWCFSSEEALVQFRQELFFFSGVMLQFVFYWPELLDLDILIKWFRLSPEVTLKFKKEVLFRSYALNHIFEYISKLQDCVLHKGVTDEKLERVSVLLKWGLVNEEIAMSFKDVSKKYLMDFSFSSIEVQQLVQQYWDKLITDILTDLSAERKDTRTK